MKVHLGTRIKLARVAKGITQKELAEQIYRTRSLVSQIEQTGRINDFTLWQICDVLDVDMLEMKQAMEELDTAYTEAPGTDEVLQLYYELESLKEIVHYQNLVIDRLQGHINRMHIP